VVAMIIAVRLFWPVLAVKGSIDECCGGNSIGGQSRQLKWLPTA
jgi:hypothetical protein